MTDPAPVPTAGAATLASSPAPAPAYVMPSPSPLPTPPDIHKATPAEIAAASADNDKGVIHGTEAKPLSPYKMTDMLPEKPAVKDGFVELGNLRVEAAHYAEFREAMIHESKNPEMNGLVERLEKGPNKTTVSMNEKSNNEMVPHADGSAEVNWDPKHMHIADNDARRSPATRLAHELDHADEWTHDPQRLIVDSATKAGVYGNLEEKRVITGTERRNVHAIEEGERAGHEFGKGNFDCDGVCSNKPVLHQTRGGVTTELKEGYTQSGKITMDDKNVYQEIGRGQTVAYPKNEFEGMVGGDKALQAIVESQKPCNVSISKGEFQCSENRAPARELSNVR